jgi:hypothetical protein
MQMKIHKSVLEAVLQRLSKIEAENLDVSGRYYLK